MAIGSGQATMERDWIPQPLNTVKNGKLLFQRHRQTLSLPLPAKRLDFLDVVSVIILEMLIAIECIRVGQKAREKSGSILCCGMGALIALQSIMNICVATGLMPNTGLPLPFVSSAFFPDYTVCWYRAGIDM